MFLPIFHGRTVFIDSFFLFLIFLQAIGSLDLLLAFSLLSPSILSNLMLLPNRTAYSRTFLTAFSHSSVLVFHCIVSLLVDGHSSFHLLLSDCGMIRCSLACPSPSDGHDVLCLSVGLSRILLFVSVTELLPLAKFSCHAKAQTSLAWVF